MKSYKLEIEGGLFNGAHKYYTTLQNARKGFVNYVNKCYKSSMYSGETLFGDIYYLEFSGDRCIRKRKVDELTF